MSNNPKRKKRFNVNAINVICGDCNILMKRWNEPYQVDEDHFYTKCPKCGMHIKHYKKTFYRIEENGRIALEIRWDKDMEWKKEFLQKEENYWTNRRNQEEEIEGLNKAMEEEYRKEMKEAKDNKE
ncbi:hypothetical protein LCGC14_0224330 [marine sediment metagenome]|uniref:Uncharacterized protein n=1 Tax=marine sediment metagenome TaxID=412755 RepID=A0A0F9UCE9_9ZZZZ